MSKKIFVNEIEKALENNLKLSEAALLYFEQMKNEIKNPTFTENGLKILLCMQENAQKQQNSFTAKQIGDLLFISGRSVAGSIKKLISDEFVSKDKTIEGKTYYKLTDFGKEFQLEK